MNNPTKTETKKPESKATLSRNVAIKKQRQFPVVGIGASAGGLEALEQFFTYMPVKSGLAFVVIQHLDPNHKGILGELIQRITKMKVNTVTDRLKIKPNNVYIIPPNKSMSILNGLLHLFRPIESHGLRLPIDFFLRSLADELQHLSIGVILSGMGSDGSMGLKAIKEKNGMVLVQDPASAKFDSMPRSAIESVSADIIAPAGELPAKLISILGRRPQLGERTNSDKDTSALEKITILLRAYTGQDFSHYKKNTVYRRIERRMGIHQLPKIGSYIRFLQENPAEADILFNELLIGVTSFFRDSPVWEKLQNKIIPSFIDKLPDKYVIRVWITGCSTGEEAYSLGMVFKEVLDSQKLAKNIKMLIFASDIDSNAIEKARKGIYPENIASDVSPERLDRFFIHRDGQFRIVQELREMVVFAVQNVIKDAPFTKLDILMCRNLLIYIDAEMQKKLLALFHHSLNHNGLMILGNAESTGSFSEYFPAVDSKLKIYSRSDGQMPDELFDFPISLTQAKQAPELEQMPKVSENVQTITEQMILQEFSPASVLVSNKGDILYITGHTGKYLAPAAGKANMNLFSMAREGLRDQLPTAFRKALQNYNKVILHKVIIGTNGGTQITDVTLQQIEKPALLKGRVLVVFSEVSQPARKTSRKISEMSHGTIDIAELESEILRMRDEIQSTREEMQTSQEELKSTNEELKSTNEELQSTNEELTTSKEEMQSLNEELHTVNIELQGKIEDSVRINNDMKNLLNSIEVAALFLDRDLRIRQFTPTVTKIIKIINSDVGRLFTDQVSDLIYPDLADDAKEVLRTLVFREKSITTLDGRWFRIRIMPYRTFEEKIDGLVITFIDITKSKNLEKALKETGLMLHSIIRDYPGIILSLSSDGTIIEFNGEAETLFDRKRSEVIGQKFGFFSPKIPHKKAESEIKKLMQGILPEWIENINGPRKGRKIEWSVQKLMDENKFQIGIIIIGKIK